MRDRKNYGITNYFYLAFKNHRSEEVVLHGRQFDSKTFIANKFGKRSSSFLVVQSVVCFLLLQLLQLLLLEQLLLLLLLGGSLDYRRNDHLLLQLERWLLLSCCLHDGRHDDGRMLLMLVLRR